MRKALDLFCKAGGATRGLQQSGFYVVGVDIAAQPNYCGDEFVQADALDFPLDGFDFVWGSPMCQHHSWAAKRWHKEWPNQIPAIRSRFAVLNVPWVIENVVGAPLENPIRLCGLMFGLQVIRHRLFESNFPIPVPFHPRCSGKIAAGEAYTVAGHGAESKSYKLSDWRRAMGIDWMAKDELTQAVPPAYAEHIGRAAISRMAI